MGEYGRQIRKIQGVTGMSVKEVQQLEIAAKMSGRRVDRAVMHGMRGFTQAMEGRRHARRRPQIFSGHGR